MITSIYRFLRRYLVTQWSTTATYLITYVFVIWTLCWLSGMPTDARSVGMTFIGSIVHYPYLHIIIAPVSLLAWAITSMVLFFGWMIEIAILSAIDEDLTLKWLLPDDNDALMEFKNDSVYSLLLGGWTSDVSSPEFPYTNKSYFRVWGIILGAQVFILFLAPKYLFSLITGISRAYKSRREEA